MCHFPFVTFLNFLYELVLILTFFRIHHIQFLTEDIRIHFKFFRMQHFLIRTGKIRQSLRHSRSIATLTFGTNSIIICSTCNFLVSDCCPFLPFGRLCLSNRTNLGWLTLCLELRRCSLCPQLCCPAHCLHCRCPSCLCFPANFGHQPIRLRRSGLPSCRALPPH